MERVASKHEELFDNNGRRIPKGLQANVCDANRDLRLEQPEMDEEVNFFSRIFLLHWCLNINVKITAKQFKDKTERLLAIIRKNSQIANITEGVYLPVILPKLVTDDLGAELEMYLSGVSSSYGKTFGDRKFCNYRRGILANEVGVVNGSRHNQLISQMKEGPVIGLYFPNPLQGFSVNASREQMLTLPKGFILSGIDILIAMIMYPGVLARDWSTPSLDLSALMWQSVDKLLYFWPRGKRLEFGGTSHLEIAYDFSSSGLLFLG